MVSSSTMERRSRLLFPHLLKLPFENTCLLLFHFFHFHEASNSPKLFAPPPQSGKPPRLQLLCQPRYFLLPEPLPCCSYDSLFGISVVIILPGLGLFDLIFSASARLVFALNLKCNFACGFLCLNVCLNVCLHLLVVCICRYSV